ncbi:hypothetical protein [Cyanobium gracile]|uniref:Uncharacterized protein n=1 Tax=Cyanobium gracile UHCC 0281 TaxID=3110309 RepID=A0ABU5SUW4_9CYAN|nr:hypothetical protein [Cyanobium gracile]MEA5442300.1 hypothetical protein [Cyanobium gracile UHCC 0281]
MPRAPADVTWAGYADGWNIENLFLPEADASEQVRERFQAKFASLATDECLTAPLGRGALEVVVEIKGHPVRIFTAPFKSKLISYARLRGLVEGSPFAPNDGNERYRYAI